jgi:hypothetical protein
MKVQRWFFSFTEFSVTCHPHRMFIIVLMLSHKYSSASLLFLLKSSQHLHFRKCLFSQDHVLSLYMTCSEIQCKGKGYTFSYIHLPPLELVTSVSLLLPCPLYLLTVRAFIFGDTGIWTKGLMLSRLCHLSNVSWPFCI